MMNEARKKTKERSEASFNKLIEKYGSLEIAAERVKKGLPL
jgi:hypothetical protein